MASPLFKCLKKANDEVEIDILRQKKNKATIVLICELETMCDFILKGRLLLE
jgi:ADP-heptose:LPS heptosyltransferase